MSGAEREFAGGGTQGLEELEQDPTQCANIIKSKKTGFHNARLR